jgi:hypothetical protein
MMRIVPFFVGGLGLVLAGLQLVLFLPLVVGNRAVDAGMFRVDALSVAFGVLWCVVLGVMAFGVDGDANGWVLPVVVVGVGLVGMAYAREPEVLAVGWIMTGLGAWLVGGSRGKREWVMLAFIAPGVLVLLGWAVGWIGVFAPPAGGVGREWGIEAALVMGVAVCALPVGALVLGKTRGWAAGRSRGLVELCIACGPFVLAKMLVGGRWDGWGTWVLALIGTAGLLVITWQSVWKGIGNIGVVGALAMLSVIGFGLATLSPMAGVGAVVLIALAAIVSGSESGGVGARYEGAAVLAGSGVGLWLVAQGALTARYGLVAVIVLPAAMLVAGIWMNGKDKDKEVSRGKARWMVVVAVLLVVSAVYPQVVIEGFARPVAEALAGGVGAPVGLVSNWGLGLQVVSPSEVVLAALPATGIGVAMFVAWVVLYWGKRVVSSH